MKIVVKQQSIMATVPGVPEYEYKVVRLLSRMQPPIGTVVSADRLRAMMFLDVIEIV